MTNKITLMEAYLIEHLRQADVSDEEIKTKVKNKEAASFAALHDDFDFTLLHELKEKIDSIIDEGYGVRFLTFNGLVNLLQLKFAKERGQDYVVDEFTISRLQLKEDELTRLKQFVSANWQVKETADGVMITPVN